MNNNYTKTVVKGNTFEISLKGNRTTGYCWCLASLPSNLYLIGEEDIPDPHNPNSVGYGDTQVFYFKAMESSNEPVSLEFAFMRVWMNTVEVTQQWQITTVSPTEQGITYQTVNNYFVSGDCDPKSRYYYVCDTLEQFLTVFHPAATMGPHHWLDKSAFKNNVVIAVIEPVSNNEMEYSFNQTPTVKDDSLIIDYKVEKEPISFSCHWCKILLVSRSNYKQVKFITNGDESATVAIGEHAKISVKEGAVSA